MLRRIARSIAVAFAVIVVIIACLATYLSYTRFYRYQDQVDHFVASIPSEDRVVSPSAQDVFEKLDGQAMTWIATRCLLQQVAPARVPMSEWHVRGLIWQVLLPRRLPHDKIMAVYTHCMYSRDANGISAVSKAVYGKPASELTTSEAIGLVAISRQPSASPDRNPERFRENVQRLTQRYRAAS